MGHRAHQLGDVGRLYRTDPLIPEEGVYEQLDRTAILSLRRGFAPGCNVLRQNRWPSSLTVTASRSASRSAAGSPPAPRTCPRRRVRLASGVFGCYRAELSNHDAPCSSMPAILDEEEALSARHDAYAEARQLSVKDDIVLLVDFRDSTVRFVSFSFGTFRSST